MSRSAPTARTSLPPCWCPGLLGTPAPPIFETLPPPQCDRHFFPHLPPKVIPQPDCLKPGQDKVIGGGVQTPERPTSSSHHHLLCRLFRSFSLHVVPYRIRLFFSIFPRRPARPLWCLRTPSPAIPCPSLDAGEPQIPPLALISFSV